MFLNHNLERSFIKSQSKYCGSLKVTDEHVDKKVYL